MVCYTLLNFPAFNASPCGKKTLLLSFFTKNLLAHANLSRWKNVTCFSHPKISNNTTKYFLGWRSVHTPVIKSEFVRWEDFSAKAGRKYHGGAKHATKGPSFFPYPIGSMGLILFIYPGTPQPISLGLKTFIFHGFGVQRYLLIYHTNQPFMDRKKYTIVPLIRWIWREIRVFMAFFFSPSFRNFRLVVGKMCLLGGSSQLVSG